MNKIKVIFEYPEQDKNEKKKKTLKMSDTEVISLLLCDVVNSDGKSFIPECKIFENNQQNREVHIKLANAPRELE